MTPRKHRLGKISFTGLSGFAIVAVPAAMLLGVLLFVGLGPSLSVTVAVGWLGVGTFALAQHQSRRPRARRIVFLAKSRSPFAHNIYRGLSDGLEGYGDLGVSRMYPDPDENPTDFQLARLRSLDIVRADGLVIIPSTENEEMWHELVRIVRRGTVVVCIDTKPPNRIFHAHGVARPLFVGSDFAIGGRMVGRFIVERLHNAMNARAILALGPETSWPGRERVSWILYELAVAGFLDRCHAIELPNWVAPECADKLHGAIEAVVADGCEQVFVFAGNDKVALALHQRLDRLDGSAHITADVHLIGYDGTTTEDGMHVLDGFPRATATVDALPYEQGQAAAEFIAWAYEGHPPDLMTRIVAPRLMPLNGSADSASRHG
jgi:ABC-type sugar transport system substrate-binding protein